MSEYLEEELVLEHSLHGLQQVGGEIEWMLQQNLHRLKRKIVSKLINKIFVE